MNSFKRTGLLVVVITYPFPKRYFEDHMKLGDWEECDVMDLAGPLFPSKERK